MKTVYSSDELKYAISHGEKQFCAGNKKMTAAFNVYKMLGHKEKTAIENNPTSATLNLAVTGVVSEPTLIALSVMFCTTIIAVVLILSGRKGTVKPTPEGPVLTVE